ncbi:T9SS type A sorting domain-containing protein [Hymenobacter sp. NST-14]|uniref:T9SS type A sorting domain-containing protein n=1 Tax=Hymenobacter piscis TaxID=2839984 RepID=UPI001C0217B9|nr:T9SS type A sorting domain-containing protein [Hymenobacter piscis]MBT9394322.1 T9SS type A sorting domain-containing protein [Hymenobacter piscis]
MKALLFSALLAGGLLLSDTPATFAQTAPGPATADARPAHREARAYVQQHVLPAVREQRRQLESRLTSADRAQLAIYRTQLREVREKAHALRQAGRPAASTAATPGARPALSEAQQQQLQQLRTETKSILANVQALAQKYTPDINRLTQALKPRQEKWATDLRAIGAKGQAETAARPGRHHRRGGPLERLLRPAAFLLLDPNAPAPAPKARAGSQVYPNPASATTQLAYEVTKAGAVTVELLDGRGNTLRTVARDDRQDKGPHTLAVDVADLPAGIYFFKITTRAGVETRRFVKE